MKKHTIDFLLSGKVIIATFVVGLCLYTWLYISYNKPEYIEYKYTGIKYQAGNPQSAEPVNIEIKGKYVKELFVKEVEFFGTIKIGERVFSGDPIKFNRDKMGELKSYGMIYISDKFEKLTIEIFEPIEKGGYIFSYKNGWLISAPCKSRKEAIEVSNAIIRRLHRGLVIE